MKKYPKMKPSGVEWIGDVPEHWGISRVWYYCKLGRGRVISQEEILENQGEFPVFSSQTENDGVLGHISTFDFEGDYVTWTTDGANAGTVFFRSGKFNCTNVCGTIQPIKEGTIYLPFLKYGLSISTRFYVRMDINPKLMNNVMAGIQFCLPIFPEQTTIAAYLDRKTAQIDQSIAEKGRLIELFREERQAIINHAVTKGIRPGAKMKPSGVEWIGDVPEGWEVKRLKYVSELIQTGKTPPSGEEKYYQDGDVNWFNPSDFSGEILLKESQRKISRLSIEEGEIKAYKAKTVLLVGIGATLGKVGIIDKEGCSNQQINAITLNEEKANPFFVAYFLESFSQIIVSYSNASTLAIFNQTQTKNFEIVVPPRTEQDLIVNFIDQKTAQIDTAISGIWQEIALLQEYRQALIFEAVTGKIDVREV